MMAGMPLPLPGSNLKRADGKQGRYRSLPDKWNGQAEVQMVVTITNDLPRVARGGNAGSGLPWRPWALEVDRPPLRRGGKKTFSYGMAGRVPAIPSDHPLAFPA